MKGAISILLVLMTNFGLAQLPETELWGIDINAISDSSLTFDEVHFLSANNLGGYNNQPFLHADGYAMTISKAGHEQTDICFYNLNNRSYTYLTSTRLTSEYSPTIFPEDSIFMVVRVDSSGNQNLWSLPLNLSHGGHDLFPGINNVGYYHRISQDSFLVFLTDEPNQLAILRRGSTDKYVITSNIGRSLLSRDGYIYFVHHLTPNVTYLKQLNIKTRRST
ncbi:MAG: hypothetical protein R3275_10610, partial [Saprospiraceae bacterium]|nr:hypothetical protein [Saprospiraceae bacterium]